ncbi:hypothetical protein FZI91_18650 [Mycobacterium sp. CBMA271]|uniref:hypothetical protein n=1 Tax=Mycobacteroides sp. CBMA 326 TaxID=1904945 RepID=UPI0012DE78B6|nr:hypothetical protein [Mycobacteroides sp. CBMA 326]MUM23705.1 hypothetical protein [Mycobacteroides sp. CBMA 271]
MALTQLGQVVDFERVSAFVMSRGIGSIHAGRDMYWYEIVLIEGDRLILWHGKDGHCPGYGGNDSHPRLVATLRTIALSEISDQSLVTEYDLDADGATTLAAVDLTVGLSATYRTVKTSLEEYRHTIDYLRFAKESSHGVAQMNQVIEFAQALSREAR